jgi:hypothetical protein
MGILTELFLATDDEARAYDGDSAERFESVQLGGLTSLHFETLWSILDGKEWGPESHGLEEVRPSGHTWTFKFPAAYVERLRALDSRGTSAAAKQWAATEELACDPADVEPVIDALVSLARSLGSGDLHLFLWGSL